MTVCVCVSSTKQCRGWCAFGKAYVRASVHVCESAYVHMSPSAYYTRLCFPDKVLCSILHDLQSKQQVFFYERERVWKEPRLGVSGPPR